MVKEIIRKLIDGKLFDKEQVEKPQKENDSAFIKFFGNYPIIRVLDFLIENRYSDYSKTEVSKGANVSWATLHHLWKKLEELGIVRQTRAFGNSKLYKLNEKNEIVKELIKIEFELIKEV